jgi:hypothetical protein
MNKLESLTSRFFSSIRVITRGSEALNAEQQNKDCYLKQMLSLLLTYRPTPPIQHWLSQDSKLGTRFSYSSLTLLGLSNSTSANLNWELLGLLLLGTGLAVFAYFCCKKNLDMAYTSPSLETLFKVELEQSIDIKEFEKEVLQVEQENKRKLEELVSTPESALKTHVAQIMHLVAEGEFEKDFHLKAKKFSEAEKLVWNLAIASDKASVSELYEISKSYARALSAAQLFFESVHLMDLAKAAKKNNNQTAEFLYRTEAFNTLTKIHSLKWRQCPLNIRRILHLSANQLLISDVFEERTFTSELKLRLKMLLPSIKLSRDIVGNYRKSKKNYIQSILILTEIDNPFKDIEKKIREVLKKEERQTDSEKSQLSKTSSNQLESDFEEESDNFSTIESILNYVRTAPKWSGEDSEECLDYINDVRS